MRRRICVVSGTRAEYGLLRPVMRAIAGHPRLELAVLAAGMHLARRFGRTVSEILRDGFRVHARVPMDPGGEGAREMAAAVGRGVVGMAKALDRLRPHLTLVLGDRTEALAAAVASAYMNIPVAHIHGGDLSRAGLDESARHAITKLSHVHLTATETSRRRVLGMGEDPRRVFLVGAPGLDSILRGPRMGRRELERALRGPVKEEFILVLQHPVTTQIAEAGAQMRETLGAIVGMGMRAVVIYPNSDAGGRAMIREIEAARRRYPFIEVYRNLPHGAYLEMMRAAKVMVGNSSSGIIEAPSFALPVVNVGMRQDGRERSVNVIDAPHRRSAIRRAIRKAAGSAFRRRVARCPNPYGDGRASGRIARILASVPLGQSLLQKHLRPGR